MGMTMRRNDKAKAEEVLKGHRVQASGYSGKPLTIKQFAVGFLRRGNTDAGTAAVKKMEKAGWVYTDGGHLRRTTRRG